MKEQWTKEQAWQWYESQRWIRGYNGYPSNCVNRIAMWQSYKHAEVFAQIDREFALARETGFNAVRAILQFEVWHEEHDSFMSHLEEYLTLAAKYGLGVMLCLGNDCCVPKELYSFHLGEQSIDWGYHSGVCRGPHSRGYTGPGYMLADEEQYRPLYYQMVDEIAAKYAKDSRIQVWDIWNEIGNSRRGSMSVPMMEEFFRIVRSHDPIQPLTADAWSFDGEQNPSSEVQRRALELSDILTFHGYCPFADMVKRIEKLREYGRPLINNEWLDRIGNNRVEEMFPLFYLERIGSYHWGLIQGFSQTYEPSGRYLDKIRDPDYTGDLKLTMMQHDLYRFSGLPYIAGEIRLIREFCTLADRRFEQLGRFV